MWCFLEAWPLVQFIAEGVSLRLLLYFRTRHPLYNGYIFLPHCSDMKCVLVQIAKGGFVKLGNIEFLQEQRRIILNAFKYMDRKLSLYKRSISLE